MASPRRMANRPRPPILSIPRGICIGRARLRSRRPSMTWQDRTRLLASEDLRPSQAVPATCIAARAAKFHQAEKAGQCQTASGRCPCGRARANRFSSTASASLQHTGPIDRLRGTASIRELGVSKVKRVRRSGGTDGLERPPRSGPEARLLRGHVASPAPPRGLGYRGCPRRWVLGVTG